MLIVRKSLPDILKPTQIVLMQELERWNKLVNKIGTSLLDLKAMIGEIGMSDALDDLGAALFNGQVPQMWIALAPMTEKPLGSWILHFVSRVDQFEEWSDPNRGEPAVMWLARVATYRSHIYRHWFSRLVVCVVGLWINPLCSQLLQSLRKGRSRRKVRDGLLC